jgi:dipeptidyl aminopeptidase/acylaminoacyl peptidase
MWGEPIAVGDGIVATHESWVSAPRLVHITGDGAQRDLYEGTPPALVSAVPAAFERVTFESLDGLEIEGFLTRPPGVSGPVPVILYAHGGPTDAYGEEWDGHAQHFIEKGYGWMGINFRGSTSYGLDFERANHGRCGVADADDCVAAGQYLAGLDWVDPERLIIFGPSYGAYLTVAVLGRKDNPFAVGVAKYGDYNYFTSWEQTDVVGHDEFLRLMGHPDDNYEAYRAGSPIFAVPDIQVPLLFIHGEKDPRTHYKQAEELLEALQANGKQFEFVSYPNEAHGLLHRESQLDFYRRMGRFLDWHTAVDPD